MAAGHKLRSCLRLCERVKVRRAHIWPVIRDVSVAILVCWGLLALFVAVAS